MKETNYTPYEQKKFYSRFGVKMEFLYLLHVSYCHLFIQ